MLPVEELVSRVKAYQPNADTDLLARAYAYAGQAHEGQVRKSGAPYFAHPAAVAEVITELRLDAASVCAGLLHDVVEDTPQTLTDVERQFGAEVAFLVDGVTKLSKINFTSRQDREAENFRKMLVAMARDIRVLLVKLCDRVDNMRTLEYMSPEAQERISRETMEIYAPLANRLGIQRFKSELEDLAFKHLEPDAFKRLEQLVARTEKERRKYTDDMSEQLRKQIAEHGFSGDVAGRPKHLYSIHRKMVQQRVEYEQVHDQMAFRIIVESVADCYGVMGAIHARYTPVPGRIKDYIALPKPNMYQSLHTTVIGPDRERVEIQIRTRDMHRVAEQGIAAHWRYKERLSGGVDPKLVQRFTWLRELMEYQKELKDPAEFIDSIKVDLFQDEVYVFTPKGDVRVFPRGSTPIDFAYSIHTEIGHHCSGARANGSITPLRYKLHNGDVLEVITSPQQRPKKDWLEFCATSRAKNKIRAFLRAEERERSLKLGRELLEKELHNHGISMQRFLKSDELRRVIEHFKLLTTDELFIAVGYGKLAPASITGVIAPKNTEGTPEAASELKEGRIEHLVRRVTGRDSVSIKISDIDDILVRYAKCCNPLPGDEIVGFITRGRGVTVHRRNCTKSFESDPDRRVAIAWDSRAKINRTVQLKVVTANRPGLLAQMGETFSQMSVNISAVNSRAVEEGRSVNIFSFLCTDLNQLKLMMRALQKLPGVYSVERI
ncbi:MAG: bifunctional (p)ppGpp synthetase/guanosine-3',5'-bis(diphosphate) 3'-pyrophosphohydrolase [Deltaproteobacteria bacterium]|nr:bifunctional (p)ppGpp synthetase/guanosine-3',5'-bis(diphosphate) 3'-pyrophosphohydrolase [Deltaproteobacteria bacterium]